MSDTGKVEKAETLCGEAAKEIDWHAHFPDGRTLAVQKEVLTQSDALATRQTRQMGRRRQRGGAISGRLDTARAENETPLSPASQLPRHRPPTAR